ncbi:MAG: flexitail domain-containing putative surface protein [Dehalococcoidia bacterium]
MLTRSLAITTLVAVLAVAGLLGSPASDTMAGTSGPAFPTALGLGLAHTCTLLASGEVLCWGANEVGQLGSGAGNTTERPKPGAVLGLSDAATTLAVGGLHSCALLQDTGAQCWGWNRYGQLGNGTQTPPLTANPVPVNLLVQAGGMRLLGIGGIDAGGVHTCALMTATQGLKCWGWNGYGQIGVAQPCSSNICLAPRDVSGLTSGVAAFDLGDTHSCAVTTTGGVKCWGLNDTSQLGVVSGGTCGTIPPQVPCSTTPQDVAGLSNVVAVTAGDSHTCALDDAGGVKCWGDNSLGQLGDGQTCGTNTCTTPVDVTGLTSGVTDIVAGRDQTCARVATGVTCWGDNNSGQLGDGQTCGSDFCATPVNVANLPVALDAIGAGGQHSCGILTLRTVLCWGHNNHGQLGDATHEERIVPTIVLGLGGPPDSDRDGCTDGQELGPNAAFGGQRNSNKFWDFFDTPDALNGRDAIVSAGDLQRVVVRFGTTGFPGDPLSPPPASGYHAAFDRSPPMAGAHPWEVRGPDGAIAANDILFSVGQFGHTCASLAPP